MLFRLILVIGLLASNVEAQAVLTNFFDSLENHGAIGDDSTDDTAAIQAAIDAVAASGKVLLVGAGPYRHTGINMKANVRMRGLGVKVSTLRYSPASNGNAITLVEDTNNSEISDLKIDALTTSTGIAVTGEGQVREFWMNRFEIEDFNKGINIHEGINCTIEDGRILGRGVGNAGSYGVKLGDITAGSEATTTSTLRNLYITGQETCVNFDGGSSNVALNLVCETVTTSIRNKGFNTSIGGYWDNETTFLNAIAGGYGFLSVNPSVFDTGVRKEKPVDEGYVTYGDASSKSRTEIQTNQIQRY